MKKLLILTLILFFTGILKPDEPLKIFSKEEIKKLAGAYLENKLAFQNPVLVDVDKDGDFDALHFENGNVEYYKNTGSQDKPVFVLENKNYDKYNAAFLIDPKLSYPLFFADADGDGDMDLFAVLDKEYNKSEKKYDYNVSSGNNFLGLDTGTLVTIILILVIVLLVLMILGR